MQLSTFSILARQQGFMVEKSLKIFKTRCVYHVNTQEGSPSHFSNKSFTLIIILPDNQFVNVTIK